MFFSQSSSVSVCLTCVSWFFGVSYCVCHGGLCKVAESDILPHTSFRAGPIDRRPNLHRGWLFFTESDAEQAKAAQKRPQTVFFSQSPSVSVCLTCVSWFFGVSYCVCHGGLSKVAEPDILPHTTFRAGPIGRRPNLHRGWLFSQNPTQNKPQRHKNFPKLYFSVNPLRFLCV